MTQTELAKVEEATEPEALPAPATSIISVIERAALNPDVDIDKMERLLAMQERIVEREAEGAFNAALADAQAEIQPVARDKWNDQTRSNYARYEAIANAVKPIITRHGFATSFGTDQSPLENHYRITCKLAHIAGHARDYHADIPADTAGMKGTKNKTATHAFGSTMTYGRRYLTMLIFDIATDDDDGNAGSGALVSPEQFTRLRDLVERLGGGTEKALLAHYGAPSLEQFPAAMFGDAEDLLNHKISKMGASDATAD